MQPSTAVHISRIAARNPQAARPSSIGGVKHTHVLLFYLALVVAHFLEHLIQFAQVYLLGWVPKHAGGVLGLVFPALHHAEVLHLSYNFFQLGGLILLRPGFSGRARQWWTIALIAQSWHFFEHVLLQVQYLSGYYLFGAHHQTSIGQLFFPRLELHFVYNLMVFIPTAMAVYLHFQQRKTE